MGDFSSSVSALGIIYSPLYDIKRFCLISIVFLKLQLLKFKCREHVKFSFFLSINFFSYLVYQFDILPIMFIIAQFYCYNFTKNVFDEEFMSLFHNAYYYSHNVCIKSSRKAKINLLKGLGTADSVFLSLRNLVLFPRY